MKSSENLIFMIIYVEENWFEDIVQLILHADSFHPSIIFDSPLKCLWHILDLLKVVSCKVFNCKLLVCTVERERGINWAICKIKSTGQKQKKSFHNSMLFYFTIVEQISLMVSKPLHFKEQNSSIIVQGEERRGVEGRGIQIFIF